MGRNYGLEKYTEEDVTSAMWVPFWVGVVLGIVTTIVAEFVFMWAQGWI